MEREEEIGESITTLERRRQVLLKKAKEYHKELDALLVHPPITRCCTLADRIHIGKHARCTSCYCHTAHEATGIKQVEGATTSSEASKNKGVPRVAAGIS